MVLQVIVQISRAHLAVFRRLKVSFVAVVQRKRLHLTRLEDSVEVFRFDISREFSRVTIGRPLSPTH